ncbi:MAG: D-glycero-beta-D-manno-heptose 1,7-bisphosphate 7-phosphatase, partial [Burkholderiaceae bacterium]|nr:D-glycero-beta-D-manno-heptose 1,7-bisphosphate 7-phosphatase [Burkholderiaceae bacterium]
VINLDHESFIKSPEEWVPIPGSLEAIARLNQADYRVVIATNQSGIARGLYDLTMLNAIHQKMHVAAMTVGAEIDAIFFCPHAASDDCDCRKPKSGMLDAIARRYDIKLKGVPSVGDSLRDLQAAFLAGCTPYLVLTGKGKMTLANGGLPPGTTTYSDLSAVVDMLLNAESETADGKKD